MGNSIDNEGRSILNTKINTLIDYQDLYVDPLLTAVLSELPINRITTLADPAIPTLIWAQYESLPFDLAMSHPTTLLLNSYVFRKALIRKHYLATTVRNWNIKHPTTCLRRHVQPSVDFELDYAEFLDDALMEAEGDELVQSLQANEEREPREREWWILKAGMAERGGGIRIFSTMGELEGIFEAWDPESDDEDEAVGSGAEEGPSGGGAKIKGEKDEGIVTSQMRHFVAQRYVDRPLLLELPFESAGRKFHVRTYVVAVGALKIFVYRPMLALFAGREYRSPGDDEDPNEELSGHLTNTCLQTGEREGSVHAFWSLPEKAGKLGADWKEKTFKQICDCTGEVFEAAAREMMIHFQPLPNAFEIFGLDYLVDESGDVSLLEVNAFPDFAQTGPTLKALVANLFTGVVDVAIKPFFNVKESEQVSDMIKVLDIDLGRR
ncbi:tubulin--tyrosine ligase-like protein [Elsinoe australis]|uniref:Tubulin--tyrosine ligase-like protein n=1 Tax=Elsinoe australis TaxID=40998 RepID=A0A4U7BD95_9PEZI|nr:tubulin--tyrosine ligase-like protein [Elsinoe australis]